MNHRINYLKRTKFENSTQLVLCLFGIRCWASVHSKHISWFRLFGVGFMWKNIKGKGLTFNERNGYKKHFKVGGWLIEYLPYS
jgi:hypothetical protein